MRKAEAEAFVKEVQQDKDIQAELVDTFANSERDQGYRVKLTWKNSRTTTIGSRLQWGPVRMLWKEM